MTEILQFPSILLYNKYDSGAQKSKDVHKAFRLFERG